MTKPGVNIKPLDNPLFEGNFRLDLMKRVGDVALYKKTKIDKPWNHGTWRSGYEVVIIHRHNGYSLGGQYIAPAETYPSNSSWGAHGFSYNGYSDAQCLKDAEERFQMLLQHQANPEPKKKGRKKKV